MHGTKKKAHDTSANAPDTRGESVRRGALGGRPARQILAFDETELNQNCQNGIVYSSYKRNNSDINRTFVNYHNIFTKNRRQSARYSF